MPVVCLLRRRCLFASSWPPCICLESPPLELGEEGENEEEHSREKNIFPHVKYKKYVAQLFKYFMD